MPDYNKPITFGKHGSVRECNPSGLSLEDDDFCWTIEPMVQLDIQLPPARADIRFQITATPFLYGMQIRCQHLHIYCNGLFQGFFQFSEGRAAECQLPRSVFSLRANRVTLVIPTAMSPVSLGINADVRCLGLAVSDMQFAAS